MEQTYKLTRIEDVIKIATTLTRSWFRGHSKIWGNLTPGIFRKEYERFVTPYNPDVEKFLIEGFKRGSPALADRLPNIEDHIAWLFLMQHHGGPTRLLDWTESALVALYFTVYKDPDENGELWAMYPDALNKCSNIDGIPLLSDPKPYYLASEPMLTENERTNLSIKLFGYRDPKPNFPIAIQPPMTFPRMVWQLSTFTIHPKSSNGNKIEELLQQKEDLVKYIIPANYKKDLLAALAELGINRRTLFQDLDSLCICLKEESKITKYSPPDPPQCSGLWDSHLGHNL